MSDDIQYGTPPSTFILSIDSDSLIIADITGEGNRQTDFEIEASTLG